MDWLFDTKALKLGEYLIQTKSGQYLAGVTRRGQDGKIHFVSSDGSWRIEMNDIEKFTEIA